MMKMENNSLLAYSSQSRQNRPITIWNNRHTANSNLPCTPSVTPKDTRPRFCNPSSLSSHSLIYSFTPTYTGWRSRIRKSAREQICTPTHTSVCKKNDHTIVVAYRSRGDIICRLHTHPPRASPFPRILLPLAFSSPPFLYRSHLPSSFMPPFLCANLSGLFFSALWSLWQKPPSCSSR